MMDQNVSGWTRLNILTRNQTNVNQDTIGYLPTINAPATALSTVNKILTQALNIEESLDLKEIVCVLDQALYAEAADIAWKHRGKFQSIVLRMGVFHTICNFLGIIGKRFLDAWLRDVAVESEIIMEGSVDRVLSGHYYNRGILLHNLVYEALQRLIWKSFLSWFEQNLAVESQPLLHDSHLLLVDLNQSVTQENLDAVLKNPCFVALFKIFQQYLSFLRSDAGPLAQYWMSYIDMVETLLHLIRASREGNWLLHLHAIHAILPQWRTLGRAKGGASASPSNNFY